MKRKERTRLLISYLLTIGAASLIVAGISLLFAYLIHKGSIPVAWDHAVRMAALSAAAFSVGMVAHRAGRKGIVIGTGLSLIWFVWKVCTNTEAAFTMNTVTEIALCILFSMVASCIFHKKKRGYTKRNHRISRA